jgi:hypothetical protein
MRDALREGSVEPGAEVGEARADVGNGGWRRQRGRAADHLEMGERPELGFEPGARIGDQGEVEPCRSILLPRPGRAVGDNRGGV